LIYFLSRPLVPPSDPLQTALPSLELSSFLAAVASTLLADSLKSTPKTTFLIPRNPAFKHLGMLVSAHLLSASSKPDLEKVILHHVLDGVQYAASFQNGSQRTFPTLEGSDIQLERSSNGTLMISPSGGWAGMRSQVHVRNVLTQTGVIHELSDLVIPRSVSLTISKLIKAAKGTTMISLLNKAGMDWVLNGTAPPDGSPWADLNGVGWTLLCPTDDAFKRYNLTELFADADGILRIVSQHLIPTPPVSKQGSSETPDLLTSNQPLHMGDLVTYSTLLSPSSAYGDIVFRSDGQAPQGFLVGINGARGTEGRTDWAHVISWGRSTTSGGTGGVIAIDRVLLPYYPSWWVEYRSPAGVFLGGIILICLFFWGVRAIWRRDTTEATYEPVGGFGADDE
jgi:solute carrier family 25 carnitine/acylcarnitine transporter 20/29